MCGSVGRELCYVGVSVCRGLCVTVRVCVDLGVCRLLCMFVYACLSVTVCVYVCMHVRLLVSVCVWHVVFVRECPCC